MARVKGGELGVRSELIPNVQSSLALWALKLDSELVFVGDAGNTEAGRPSRRYGVEWSNRWRPQSWMVIDLDVSWNRARFIGDAPEGKYIPGALSMVAQAGVAMDCLRGMVKRPVPALHRLVPADRGQQRALMRNKTSKSLICG